MSYVRVVVWALVLGWARPSEAGAQPRQPDHTVELELIESTERGEDPLGIDESTGRGLDEAASKLVQPRAVVVLPSAVAGETLSAIEGVSETAHELELTLEQGLAFVRAHLRFESRSKHRAEVSYRLAIPASAVVTAVRVCLDATCADAQPVAAEQNGAYFAVPASGTSTKPRARVWAESIEDARGRALGLRAAPLSAGAVLELVVDYVAEAPLRGGYVRFEVPARGYDARAAKSELRIVAPDLEQLSPGAELTRDPWTPIALRGALRPLRRPLVKSSRARCGPSPCERRVEAASTASARERPTWLWLDSSPSMEGPARGRADVVVAALLTALSPDTPVRAFAFAGRTEHIGDWKAIDAPLNKLSDALMWDLGAATRPSSAVALTQAELAHARPRIVVVSDGLVDSSPAERQALDKARQRGADLWLIAVGDSAPGQSAGFARTNVLHVPELADAAVRQGDLEPLREALSVVSSPLVSVGFPAGAQRVTERGPNTPYPLRASDPWLAFWMARARRAPSWLHSEGGSGGPVIAALPFVSVAAAAKPSDTGMPKESVLNMLRTQLVPQARACLRSDRKGRGDYAVELTFHGLFARREVSEASVQGDIPAPLRECLEALLPKLRVPAFSGRIRVRYPIHTERESPPPVIELEPDVAAQVQRVIRSK